MTPSTLKRTIEGNVEVIREPLDATQASRQPSDLAAWALVVALQKYLRTYADWRVLQSGGFRSPDRQ